MFSWTDTKTEALLSFSFYQSNFTLIYYFLLHIVIHSSSQHHIYFFSVFERFSCFSKLHAIKSDGLISNDFCSSPKLRNSKRKFYLFLRCFDCFNIIQDVYLRLFWLIFSLRLFQYVQKARIICLYTNLSFFNYINLFFAFL